MSSLFKKVMNNSDIQISQVINNSSSIKEVIDVSTKITDSENSLRKVSSYPEPKINYRFYNEKVCECLDIPEEYFTNLLPDKWCLDGYIEMGINSLEENPQLIAESKNRDKASCVNCTGTYKEHIKAIMAKYDDLHQSNGKLISLLEDGFIRKSGIQTPLGDNGSMRLISLYRKDIETGMTYFELLFIDFYHLFIPSKHNGKDPDYVRKDTYKKRSKSCSYQLSEYLVPNIFD